MFKAKLKKIPAVLFAALFLPYLVLTTLMSVFFIAFFIWETGVSRLLIFIFSFFAVPVAAGVTACVLYLKNQKRAAAGFFAWFFFMQLCFWGIGSLYADWNDGGVLAVSEEKEER